MDAAVTTAITTMFTGISTDVIPIMTPIAASAVPIFVIFIAIKYGKQLWQVVAKKN